MIRKAIIVGIKGTKLTKKEKYFLKINKPWGVILFSRNIKDFFQLRLLTKNIKNIVKDQRYPILIDQEGGMVSRINKIIDLSLFSQSYFGNKYEKNSKNFQNTYKIYLDSVCKILNYVGVNINTVPVLDVKRNITHKIISCRT